MDTLKVLGQLYPLSSELTDLYVVPPSTYATASSLTVCNQTGSAASFHFSIAVGGATDDPKQYIYFDLFLDANDSFISTVGLSLGPGDVARVRSSITGLSFSLFGVEIS